MTSSKSLLRLFVDRGSLVMIHDSPLSGKLSSGLVSDELKKKVILRSHLRTSVYRKGLIFGPNQLF
jgi:hypothetical protein